MPDGGCVWAELIGVRASATAADLISLQTRTRKGLGWASTGRDLVVGVHGEGKRWEMLVRRADPIRRHRGTPVHALSVLCLLTGNSEIAPCNHRPSFTTVPRRFCVAYFLFHPCRADPPGSPFLLRCPGPECRHPR